MQKQIGGNHYQQFPFQPTEFIHKMGLNFCQGNVIKYVCRYKFKNGLQDLEKALHYAEMLKDFHAEGYGETYNFERIDNPIVKTFFDKNSWVLNPMQVMIIKQVLLSNYDATIYRVQELITDYTEHN
jgi:hypothetical protein